MPQENTDNVDKRREEVQLEKLQVTFQPGVCIGMLNSIRKIYRLLKQKKKRGKNKTSVSID
jgi:hypothetical protein